jgi:hypothetical protein
MVDKSGRETVGDELLRHDTRPQPSRPFRAEAARGLATPDSRAGCLSLADEGGGTAPIELGRLFCIRPLGKSPLGRRLIRGEATCLLPSLSTNGNHGPSASASRDTLGR